MSNMIRVDYRSWHALKCAAAKLDISIIELVSRFGRGDAEAIAMFQRTYGECEEKP